MSPELIPLMSSSELATFVGKRVLARRKFLRMSRRELAEKSGVSSATLSRLESSGTATLLVLAKVAIALGGVDTFSELLSTPKARSFDEFSKLHRDDK
jgi:transcriptional regulator with XRE-family HTH domain